MAQKKAPEDKAVKIGSVATKDQATLEHAFDPERQEPAGHRVSVCYNAACPDYREERRDGRPCGCKIRRVEAK